MSDKTLVERLRNGSKVSICIAKNLEKILDVKFPCNGVECTECYASAFNKLADAIEREYLPREVLDTNGVPIHKNDTVWHVDRGCKYTVVSLPRNSNEYQAVGVMTEKGVTSYYDPPMLTHKQPVLDADDVIIKVEDTVYYMQNAEPLKVVEIDDEGWVICLGGVNNERHLFPHPEIYLTHKQPDSLERIEEDAKKSVCEYFAKQDKSVCDSCNGLHYLECRRDMNLELLRRQRKILERDRKH